MNEVKTVVYLNIATMLKGIGGHFEGCKGESFSKCSLNFCSFQHRFLVRDEIPFDSGSLGKILR